MLRFREPATVRFVPDSSDGSFAFTFLDDQDVPVCTLNRSFAETESLFYLLFRETLIRVLQHVQTDEIAQNVAFQFAQADVAGALHPDAKTLLSDRKGADLVEWIEGPSFASLSLRLTLDDGDHIVTVSIGAVILLLLRLAQEIRAFYAWGEARDRRDHPEDFED